MSRMTRDNWLTYAIMRNEFGIDRAEQYRHKCNKRNAQYGLTNNKPSELPQWTFVTADCDSRIEKRFSPESTPQETSTTYLTASTLKLPTPCTIAQAESLPSVWMYTQYQRVSGCIIELELTFKEVAP